METETGFDPTEQRVVSVVRPSRKLRREADGRFCDLCPNRVHFADAVAVIYTYRTAFAHAECVALAVEQTQKENTDG